ncbi:MAG: hypothetical protein ACRDL7_07785, partial [Gaiellaceae bacterium]
TSTKKAIDRNCTCPFKFTFFLSAMDNCWYLVATRKEFDGEDSHNTHKHHAWVSPDSLRPRSTQMDQDSLKLVHDSCTAFLPNAMVANLLAQRTDTRWLPRQIEYLYQKSSRSLECAMPGASSADALVKSLKSR